MGGIEDVFASGGWVGNHTERMHPGPYVVIGRKGSAGKITYAPNGGWVTDTAYFAVPLHSENLNCKFLFYTLRSVDFSGDIISTFTSRASSEASAIAASWQPMRGSRQHRGGAARSTRSKAYPKRVIGVCVAP
jgi:hypothetical protein